MNVIFCVYLYKLKFRKMDKKEISTSLLFAGLSILFVFISFMVWLYRGESKYWLSRKIKIGAALLTLTAFQHSCRPTVSCYDPIPPNQISMQSDNDTLLVNLSDSNILKGTVYDRTDTYYSFKLMKEDTVKQESLIMADDGTFDEDTEEFTLEIEEETESGLYKFIVSSGNEANTDNHYDIRVYDLNVINEK